MTDKEYMISRLKNCLVPTRFANYPDSWYTKLTIKQLYRLCEEIIVEGPTQEDYEMDKIKMDKAQEGVDEVNSLKAKYPTFPYRFNPDNNDLEVYTELKCWERVYD